MYKVGILGVGKMGSCILEGMVKANLYTPVEILIYTPNEEHQKKYKTLGYNIASNEIEVFTNATIIILAIKPQKFSEVLIPAKNYNFSNQCIISIAAGISIKTIETYFKAATIVRAMPNTPALIQQGATTICYNHKNDYSLFAKKIFSSIGVVEEIEESQMDITLPLNGSMPAYIYLFAKSFIEYAVSKGIPLEVSKNLCCNTIIGSSQMILSSKDSLDILIQNVCSKGGTTIEGLNELYKNNFIDSIEKCYDACVKRAKELNKE